MDERPPPLGLLCFIAARAMEEEVTKAIAEAGFDDVTLAQARIFARIGPAGTRVSDLAEQARVTKQTAGFLVEKLERAGYVTRGPDPRDGRARLVHISPRGQAVITVARRVEDQIEAEWQAHLGRRLTGQLREALTRLREITDPYQ